MSRIRIATWGIVLAAMGLMLVPTQSQAEDYLYRGGIAPSYVNAYYGSPTVAYYPPSASYSTYYPTTAAYYGTTVAHSTYYSPTTSFPTTVFPTTTYYSARPTVAYFRPSLIPYGPRTAYRPVVTAAPLTNTAVTAYYPTTPVVVQQTRVVPYTSYYRPVLFPRLWGWRPTYYTPYSTYYAPAYSVPVTTSYYQAPAITPSYSYSNTVGCSNCSVPSLGTSTSIPYNSDTNGATGSSPADQPPMLPVNPTSPSNGESSPADAPPGSPYPKSDGASSGIRRVIPDPARTHPTMIPSSKPSTTQPEPVGEVTQSTSSKQDSVRPVSLKVLSKPAASDPNDGWTSSKR